MRNVYTPDSAVEAHMLSHVLEQAGITAHIHGEALQGGMGDLPAAGLFQLLVADEDYDKARAILLDWERRQIPPAEKTEAPAKRRMGLGWLLVICCVFAGIVGGWVLRGVVARSDSEFVNGRDELDINGDGRTDLTYYYPIGSAYATRMESDNNFNGSVDMRAWYDERGMVIRDELDDDFDGRFETKGVYEHGVLRQRDVDRDGNGVTDQTFHLIGGTLVRETILDSGVGRVARVNYYENGVVARSELDLDRDGTLETRRSYDRFGEIIATESD